jgi:hypothetical protein
MRERRVGDRALKVRDARGLVYRAGLGTSCGGRSRGDQRRAGLSVKCRQGDGAVHRRADLDTASGYDAVLWAIVAAAAISAIAFWYAAPASRRQESQTGLHEAARRRPHRFEPGPPGGLAQATAQIGTFVVPALLPTFIDIWALSNTEAGWITGIYYAGYTLCVPVLASLADRMDAKKIYVASTMLTATANLAYALVADGFCSALLFRALRAVRCCVSWHASFRGHVGQPRLTYQTKPMSPSAASAPPQIGQVGARNASETPENRSRGIPQQRTCSSANRMKGPLAASLNSWSAINGSGAVGFARTR